MVTGSSVRVDEESYTLGPAGQWQYAHLHCESELRDLTVPKPAGPILTCSRSVSDSIREFR